MEFFTVENLEIFLLIVVRMSAFVVVAPFYGMTNTPMRVKAGFSLAVSVILFQVVDYKDVTYTGVIGYAGLVVQEAIVGLLIGYFANICSTILNFAGQIIDMEIGFSMVNVLDPVSNIQTTITGNFYSYLVMLMMLISNMHHFLIEAFVHAYDTIGIGEAIFRPDMYRIMVMYMVDYFVIGFRIVLPVFASILLVNVVLAILAKVAPQMNMFVIGIQLKILVGLVILFFMIGMLRSISDAIFLEMEKMMSTIINYMK